MKHKINSIAILEWFAWGVMVGFVLLTIIATMSFIFIGY